MGTPRKPRINTRKIYEDAYGKLPAGMEVHHKLPSRLGGSDDLSNLEAVTLEEHKQRHLDLYEKYGDWRDLTAYYMIGNNFTKAALVAASRGGKRAGELYKERGQPQGFQAFPAEKRRVVAAKAGSIWG